VGGRRQWYREKESAGIEGRRSIRPRGCSGPHARHSPDQSVLRSLLDDSYSKCFSSLSSTITARVSPVFRAVIVV